MENTSLHNREPEVVETARRATERVASPRADIVENPEAVVVLMDVPGVSDENVDVTLENDVLTVVAHVSEPEREGYELAWSEYNPTVYRRQFAVSNRVDSEGITAQLRNGVLRVMLNKSEAAKTRKIEVQG